MLVRIGDPRVLARRAALTSIAASVAVVGMPVVASAAPPDDPFISEIHYDNDGGDAGEFVEVQFPVGVDSSNWKIEAYNGSNGAQYGSRILSSVSNGVAVVNFAGLQNGSPDGLALVDPDGVLVEFLSYEGEMTATNSTAVGLTSTDIGVLQDGSGPVGETLSRSIDGEGAYVWHGPGPGSPGEVNPPITEEPEPEPSEACDVTPTHRIGEVQGAGSSTPLNGQQVTVRGAVVGDVPSFQGFYLQDAAGDGNEATSDGIFVFSPVEVALGDEVAVTGAAQEYFGQTQISSWSDVAVCSDAPGALPEPAPLELPADDAGREPREGMLVQPADTLTVSEVFALTRYGELTLSEGGVLVQPTELARPGSPEAQAIAAQNQLRQITLDDGLDSGTSTTDRPYLSITAPVRVGDELSFTSPVVLGFGFGKWRLQPADGTAEGTFAPQNTRPAAPDEVGGDVQVGAFNVLNYFLTWSGSSDVARGARSEAAFLKQADKIVTAIGALDADVVTLMEIEDTDSTGFSPGDADQAIADLVNRLNAAAGSDVWSYVPLPAELYAVDRDVIRNAIIYRNDVVQTVGRSQGVVDESVWFNAREPIAQTFVKDGDAFTVVANHFKSKSDSRPPQSGEGNDNVNRGQGAFNGDRTRQAASLAVFADELRDGPGGEDLLLMGDFNAYSQEDPIVDLREDGFADLGERLDPGRYSYVFDSLSGSLDHALATAELTKKVTDVAHWNINAVESFAYQYSGDPGLYAPTAYRSSDHDPLVLGLDLAERCQGLVPTIVGTDGDDVLRGGNGRDVIMGLGGNDTITGGNAEDVICGGAGNDTLAGGNGDDILSGGFGEDRLTGDNGADTLIGGPGTDTLTQGRGTGAEEQEGVES